MSELKTNVSIKFNSIKEYIEIEKKLDELGYVNDKEWNETYCKKWNYIVIYEHESFSVQKHRGVGVDKTYNSLEEFLNDK